MKKYEMFFPSHLQELTEGVIINYGKENERTFDILNQKDREKLLQSLKEEAEVLKENKKIPITQIQMQRITPEKIEQQIDKLVQFATQRQEELKQQGVKPYGRSH